MKMSIVLGIVLSVLSLTVGLGYAEAPHALEAENVEPSAHSTRGVMVIGPCTIQTIDGYYLTAVGGGGRITDVIHTDATSIGSWEQFTLFHLGNRVYGLRTVNGNWLTAVDGGGRITDVLHSDAIHLQAWEEFTFHTTEDGYTAIATTTGHYLTAVGRGGRITDTIHSDATRIDDWEKFSIDCSH